MLFSWKFINGNQAYNKKIYNAEGLAAKVINEAEGYAAERRNMADGDALLFESIYNEYDYYNK